MPFTAAECAKDPCLEHCTFEGMCDDGIAIHGSYVQVDHVEANKLIVGSLSNRTYFQPGDPIRVYGPFGNLTGEATVREVQKRSDIVPPGPSTHRLFKNRSLHYFMIQLDHAVPAGFDSLACDPSACGAGFVIRDNSIRNHRARGLLLKADDGLVEGNTIDGSTIAGIVLSPEFWWNEADYSHNVTVRHNTIRHTGYATSGPLTGQAGGLTITAEGDSITSESGSKTTHSMTFAASTSKSIMPATWPCGTTASSIPIGCPAATARSVGSTRKRWSGSAIATTCIWKATPSLTEALSAAR